MNAPHGKKVTILLAAYKGERYIRPMIESILAQDCEDWRLVLSDDGTDTSDILADYAARFPDRIEHHISGKRFGSAQKHFLYLTEQYVQASPYLMYCDQDDIWHPDKVRVTLACMEETERHFSGPVLVHTDLRVVDAELKELDPSFMHFSRLRGSDLSLHQLLVQNVVTGCTVMINKNLAQLALLGKDCRAMRMHDWWLVLCASAFGRAVFLPEATVDYRQHSGNVVGAKKASSLGYMLNRMKGGVMRHAMLADAAQAAAFAACYQVILKPADRDMLVAFASIFARGKLYRMRVFRRYGLYKQDLRRRLGQLLWW